MGHSIRRITSSLKKELTSTARSLRKTSEYLLQDIWGKNLKAEGKHIEPTNYFTF